ncbi:MAG: GNAT family N-acetyltransferase [Thiomonas arsenitoxydans]|uniref:GNAT family N-acetyltransferase n=1 Tax=Thiomonas arsenitoxydans (strain DSM 22701 / CIP 110005 / 3As) TaxID=426114 RepID=A0A8I1MW83_THIA3|nr:MULTISPECIES: GNAT family N-acetyltransferase [Thiomonas]MBN8743716.1 GNAT family N-acetyltransferase [Thiomonas arsenitoxydans]ODU98636.1 MAG: cellulose biosynthesis protein CelD [Thiomonas sp. SCN 64-16]
MQIELITTTPAFDALEPEWRAIEGLTPRNSLFLSWDWQRLWWSQYGEGRELQILVARFGGQAVGIFPLYLETHRAFKILRVRKLRPLGSGGDTAPDDLGMLFDPAHEQAVARAFVDHVLNNVSGWQLLDLVDLPADSALVACWTQQSTQISGSIERTPVNRIIYGDLPPDWERYRKGLSRNRREVLGRKRRKFEAQQEARFFQIQQDAQIDWAFERLAELHRLRWQGRTEELSFTSPQYLEFHRALMHALLAQGRLRLYGLEMSGQTIAMFYGFRNGATLYYFQAGFDPQHLALSPGEVLMGYVIEAAIGERCTRFDMLKGDYDHKRHYFQQTRETLGLRVHRPGLIRWLYRVKARLAANRASAAPAEDKDVVETKLTAHPVAE